MYLTRILLDAKSKETAKGILRPNHFHANLENCFPGDRKRRLWRLDSVGGNLYLLVLSEDNTSFDSFVDRFNPRAAGVACETKEYKEYIEGLEKDVLYRFRLVANPVHAVMQGKMQKGKRGKVMAHLTPDHQKGWLIKRQDALGMEVIEEELQIVSSRWVRFRNRKRLISLLQVAFEGVLRIKDEEQFKETLINGVGRGKAFGCGLMTVMPLNNDLQN